jgi:hypothetical protein
MQWKGKESLSVRRLLKLTRKVFSPKGIEQNTIETNPSPSDTSSLVVPSVVTDDCAAELSGSSLYIPWELPSLIAPV